MVTQHGPRLWPEWATQAEFQALLLRRLDALDSCTAEVMGGKPMPVQWRRGWSARIAYAGRDRDGSLLATITITGPQNSMKWLQRVRLVRQRELKLHRR
jgi:ligand-binding SRPBCC domain-containing protein